jgi:nucleoside-diphosphate-sugar epimerase
MKTVMLTGGTGFVGANLARRLLHDGHRVHLLIRPQAERWRLHGVVDDLHLHTIESWDTADLTSVVKVIKPDWIFHMAAFGAYSFQTDVHAIMSTNLMGTSNLVQACLQHQFEAFIHTGSSSEYGYKDHPPAETEWVDPNSYYAVAKAAATQYCRYTALAQKRPIVTLRLYSVYGRYEEPRRLMPNLIKKGLAGHLPHLSSPDTARDFIAIDDVLDACLLVAQRSPDLAYGEVFNIGTGVQSTLRQVIEVAREVLEIQQEPAWGSMGARQWDTNNWVADTTHTRQTLQWEALTDFRTGFSQMVEWFKEHSHFYADL